MSEIKNITYNPEPEIIIKKYKETHFDKNTEITVPKDCAAVLYFSGKVLDLLEEGSYLLTPENIPNTAKTLDIESEDGFDVGLCFCSILCSRFIGFDNLLLFLGQLLFILI